jgi:hypothetical protein
MNKKRKERVIVKGNMRSDKVSYYIVILKLVRELLCLKGGEYFNNTFKNSVHQANRLCITNDSKGVSLSSWNE